MLCWAGQDCHVPLPVLGMTQTNTSHHLTVIQITLGQCSHLLRTHLSQLGWNSSQLTRSSQGGSVTETQTRILSRRRSDSYQGNSMWSQRKCFDFNIALKPMIHTHPFNCHLHDNTSAHSPYLKKDIYLNVHIFTGKISKALTSQSVSELIPHFLQFMILPTIKRPTAFK